MSATLFLVFEPPINEDDVQIDDGVLFKMLYGDFSGLLTAEELKTLRSFVVNLSDKCEDANVAFTPPVFAVEKGAKAISDILMRLNTIEKSPSLDLVIGALEKLRRTLEKAAADPFQMFYIGIV